jgi:large conductance mechanosensitive channel
MKKIMNKEEVEKKGKKTWGEFKDFISKGNVMDLAVGVIIGSAFGKIVSSIVDDILMPIIGVIIGGIDFSNLSVKIGEATITYGNFIQNVIDFLIIAVCIFAIVKVLDKFNKKKEVEEVKEEPKKDEKVSLLEEIRDLLKENEKVK